MAACGSLRLVSSKFADSQGIHIVKLAKSCARAQRALGGIAVGQAGVTWCSLFVTPNTLKTYLRMIYRKPGDESREEAAIRAREGGLI